MEGNTLHKRQAAFENKYFLQLQEEAASKHRAWLLRSDPARLARAAAAPSQLAHGMLPQIAAHMTRLQAPVEAEVRRSFVYAPVHDKYRLRPGPSTGAPLYVGNLKMGSKLSLGAGKWAASTGTVAGASIFDVQGAYKLIDGTGSELPPQRSVPAATESVVKLGGVRLRLLPEMTPGRALLWGSVLAVWATSAAVLRAARALEIRSVADVRSGCAAALGPVGGRLAARLEPVKAMLGGQSSPAGQRFAAKLKTAMA